MSIPAFIITIDTEGDNLWKNCGHITTKNARFLPRFQDLCEKYCLKPIYLTNYEMAMDDAFIEFARYVTARGNAEIGMHLHAWNSPPISNITDNDWLYKPYLIEYPESVMRAKILFMTQLLEDTFQMKILSHRAGRWAFDKRYATILLELGYKIDCSVTPRVDWSHSLGAPLGVGGVNYCHFPDYSYFIDLEDISRPGTSHLLEIPLTTAYKYSSWINTTIQVYNRLRKKQRSPSVQWFRPVGKNAIQMYQLALQSIAAGNDYIEFMLHSSEMMPGGSPTFKDEASIEQLYYDLEVLFDRLKNQVIGMTLSQYYQRYLARSTISA